ncbi:MAG: hypothetical protein NT015_07255 [Alphaproteobacteria bacterium]|nr:hypothetical protein [Alphaproteobacteria bacterium]
MRTLALAAIFGVGLLAGGVAAAEPYSDPHGRLTFNAPAGWRVQPQNAGGQTAVLAFNAQNDCFFFGADNAATATSSADAARNTRDPITPQAWVTYATPIRDFFEGTPPTLVSQSVDTSGFWPVQRAELRGPSKTVYGAVLIRPGVEIRAFCSGATSAAAYDAIFASLAHPNDAAWQQAAETQRSQRESHNAEVTAQQQAQEQAQAQQGETAQQQEQTNERRRRSRDPSRDH